MTFVSLFQFKSLFQERRSQSGVFVYSKNDNGEHFYFCFTANASME